MLSKLFKKKKDSTNIDSEFTAENMAKISENTKSSELDFMKREVKNYIINRVKISANGGGRETTVSYADFMSGYVMTIYSALHKDNVSNEMYEQCKQLSSKGFIIEKSGEDITIRW